MPCQLSKGFPDVFRRDAWAVTANDEDPMCALAQAGIEGVAHSLAEIAIGLGNEPVGPL